MNANNPTTADNNLPVIEQEFEQELEDQDEVAHKLAKILAETLIKDLKEMTQAHEQNDTERLINCVSRRYEAMQYCEVPRLKASLKNLMLALCKEENTKTIKSQLIKFNNEAKVVIYYVSKLPVVEI